MRIDAHLHFWNYDASMDWITDEMAIIRKNFLPRDLEPVLNQHNFDACVAIQVNQNEEENNFFLELAKQHPFIKGIVGWVDFCSDTISERLDYYSTIKLIKGFRHLLQAETNEAFMLEKNFLRGIRLLERNNFSYDILIHPKHLPYALQFVKKLPNQKFVIDHLAKPDIKSSSTEEWKRNIILIAECKNVYCKVSGMVTETDFKNWKQNDFIPYLDIVFNAFTPQRIMYGSDWPVCLVAGNYSEVLRIVSDYTKQLSVTEQQLIFGENATQFYNLSHPQQHESTLAE